MKHKFDNKLLKRQEVTLHLDSKSNPGFAGATKSVAEEFGAAEELVVVKNVKNSYGTSKFVIHAFIYDSAEAKETVERKVKVKEAKS